MNPSYVSFSELFEHKPSYFVPRYQRAYAWEDTQVGDFIKDVKHVFESREGGASIEHFFGGIICVDIPYPGAPPVKQYEIIDGQQRLTTFSLLVHSIISHYQELSDAAELEGEAELVRMCKTQLDDLKKRFLEFDQMVAGEQVTIPVMKLSKRDNDFYSSLIRLGSPAATKESHERLKSAFDNINSFTRICLDGSPDLSGKFNKLQVFENALAADFKILLLSTATKKDAYRLFQVINDRGVSLTDADLIRSKVLELLEGNTHQQDEAEQLLDQVVSHENSEEQLSWVFESVIGKKPRSDAMFDDYMGSFFSTEKEGGLTLGEVNVLLEEVRALHRDVLQVRDFQSGLWPYDYALPITAWDRDRLSVLVEYLANSASIPLLLSARGLDHRKFSEIVQMLERFFYRYKTMCNGHNSPLKAIYNSHSLAIRENPEGYNVDALRVDLNNLMEQRASEDSFKIAINELFYSKRGGNKPLKHLLLMINQYWSWFNQGAHGNPACLDKSIIRDRREGATIEHIYPKGLSVDDEGYDDTLEGVKNSISNLTILPAAENTLVGTECFDEKKNVYKGSSSELARFISQEQDWDGQAAQEYCDKICQVAFSIFRA
tara:strand:+ start:8156 stop:9967 length:1812 start_codon:yes stop_codon:yes gene_type:complete